MFAWIRNLMSSKKEVKATATSTPYVSPRNQERYSTPMVPNVHRPSHVHMSHVQRNHTPMTGNGYKATPKMVVKPYEPEEDSASSLLSTVVAAELISSAFSDPSPSVVDSSPTSSDFGGFDGGSSGGAGVSGDYV